MYMALKNIYVTVIQTQRIQGSTPNQNDIILFNIITGELSFFFQNYLVCILFLYLKI